MGAEPNNGVVVGDHRLLIVAEPGEPSLVRDLASAAVAVVTEVLGGGEGLDDHAYRLRVTVDATGEVVAERRFRRHPDAQAARETIVARHADLRDPDWQSLLDAVG